MLNAEIAKEKFSEIYTIANFHHDMDTAIYLGIELYSSFIESLKEGFYESMDEAMEVAKIIDSTQSILKRKWD